MVKRAMELENVYAPVAYHDYGVVFTPNYLPFQWAPFLLPALLDLDLRWIIVAAFIAAAALHAHRAIKGATTFGQCAIIITLPFVLVFSIYIMQGIDAAHTI